MENLEHGGAASPPAGTRGRGARFSYIDVEDANVLLSFVVRK